MDTSVYIHFPWCLQKCPYCDFATQPISRPDVPHTQYADAVIKELRERAPLLEGKRLYSVFFGGGTPSLWAPEELGRVLSEIRSAFVNEVDDVEITVECNPSSLNADKARALRNAGVNRLSIGVQTLNETRLKFLGRLHDREMAFDALRGAMQSFDRVSGDLIFGNPEEKPDEFVRELEAFIALGLSHVSAYSLTIEPGTQFGALAKKGKLPLAQEDDVAESYVAGELAMKQAGFEHYEVSNYAKPGQASRHNQHYWRGGDYLGLGAAAVGCIASSDRSSRRYRNHPKPEQYMAASASVREESEETLTPDDRLNEALMLGLRTQEGVNCDALAASIGVDPRQARDKAVQRALSRGDLVQNGAYLRAPHDKWLRLDSIVAALF